MLDNYAGGSIISIKIELPIDLPHRKDLPFYNYNYKGLERRLTENS